MQKRQNFQFLRTTSQNVEAIWWLQKIFTALQECVSTDDVQVLKHATHKLSSEVPSKLAQTLTF